MYVYLSSFCVFSHHSCISFSCTYHYLSECSRGHVCRSSNFSRQLSHLCYSILQLSLPWSLQMLNLISSTHSFHNCHWILLPLLWFGNTEAFIRQNSFGFLICGITVFCCLMCSIQDDITLGVLPISQRGALKIWGPTVLCKVICLPG